MLKISWQNRVSIQAPGCRKAFGRGSWRRGSALPGVLMVILVLSLLGAGLLSLSLVERQGAYNEVKITQASYLAEAGINLALANLRRDPGWRDGLRAVTLPQAKGQVVEVDLTPQVISYNLRSVGEVDGIRRALEVELARPFFSYALAVAGNMTLKNPVSVTGDLFAMGNIQLQKGASGNVAAGMDLTIQNNTAVQGSVVTGHYLYNYGTIYGDATVGQTIDKYGRDPNYYGRVKGQIIKGLGFSFPAWPGNQAAAYSGGYSLAPGVYTLAELQGVVDSLPGDTKVIYVNGDLTVAAENDHGQGRGQNNNGDVIYYSGRAIIAAQGDINLKQDIRAAGADDAWAFVAGGDLLLDGGVTVDALLESNRYFYKQGAESIINGSLVTGGIADINEGNNGDGNDTNKGNGNYHGSIKGQLTINYNSDLIKILSPVLGETGWKVLSWRGAAL